jgi:uncharacterized cupredoxin-like copper-binding protein
MIRRSLLSFCVMVACASAAGAQARTVTITASDFKFDAPDSIPAGLTTFNLVGVGPELHHMQILRLEQGKTLADLQAAMKNPGPPPAWVSFVGGPNASVPDGKTATSVTAIVKPGNHVLLCLIPSPDGTPHVKKGMVRALTVTDGPAITQAGAPKADVVLTLYDYNFDLDKPLTAGKRTILIKNTAKQFHEAFIAKLGPNTQVTAFLQWLKDGMKGRPPVMPSGGIVGLNPGEENLLTVDLEPGEYGFYCFLPDAKDGKEHVEHGMFKQITVTK